MSETLVVREAEAADLDQLRALYLQMHPTDSANPAVEVEVLDEIIRSDNLHIFLLCDNETVLATTYLNVIPNLTRGASPYAVIENVVTANHMRRRGLGKRLMKHTIEYARERGCYKVMLLTGSKRESVHRFYRACGFDGEAKHGFVAKIE